MSATQLVFSHFWARVVLEAIERGIEEPEVSFDLGRTQTRALLSQAGLQLPDGAELAVDALRAVAENERVCFRIDGGEATPIRSYCSKSERVFQLYPTSTSPALWISGFTMHRISGVAPHEGAQAMVDALHPRGGRLLDTTTGLGYAAIYASQCAGEVVTLEVEPECHSIARQNPWSRELFSTPHLTPRLGDSMEEIQLYPQESFDYVLHDPPAFSIAGQLYSQAFYDQVHRVLRRRGRFFHYVGDPASASGGRVTQGVLRRLKSAGFQKVSPEKAAFGVLAVKS